MARPTVVGVASELLLRLVCSAIHPSIARCSVRPPLLLLCVPERVFGIAWIEADADGARGPSTGATSGQRVGMALLTLIAAGGERSEGVVFGSGLCVWRLLLLAAVAACDYFGGRVESHL